MGKWIVSLSFLSSQLQGHQLATVVLWKTNCQLTPGEFLLSYCGALPRKPSWFLINLALHVFEHNYEDYNYPEIPFKRFIWIFKIISSINSFITLEGFNSTIMAHQCITPSWWIFKPIFKLLCKISLF